MITNAIERARLLMEQNRYKEAEKEIRKNLSEDPGNPDLLSMLSICKLQEKQYKEAEELIQIAIGLAPANPALIYVYANILFEQDKYQEAEKHIRAAISLDPYNADFFAVLSAIFLRKKEWEKSLEYANKGLEISPDNITCLNLRSTALIKLDRKEASYSTIHDALQYDPDNANTHANLGWGLLEKGDHKKALEHFRKSLQTDPGSEYAKQGLVEALKSKYWLYRMFLKYAFWISNMKSGAQWTVLIGFYLGSRAVRMVASTYPSLEPFVTPMIILYVLFAISTWIMAPLSNLFLRWNVYGRYALSKTEIQTSNFVGVSLAIGLLSWVAFFLTSMDVFFMSGIFGVTMMVPLSSMLIPENPRKKLALIAYAAGLGAAGITGLTLMVFGNPAFETVGTTYIVGIALYQWVANAVLIR